MKNKKVTIKDVAQASGVSIAAVSYVINGKYNKVSNDTIQIVQESIKALNYVPNFSARSLVQNSSKLIGVIIPQTEDSEALILDNPYYSELISGIEIEARSKGYHILLSGVDKNMTYLDVSTQRNLDGAIIMGIYNEQFYEELKKISIPIVLMDSYIYDDFFYKLRIDDEYGGYLATKYLIDKGHKNIALVTGNIKNEGVIEKRFLGYKKALEEAKIFYKSNYVFDGNVSFEYGKEIGACIAEDKDITAVFTTADILATGVMSGLKSRDIKIPEDVSVVGFDDTTLAKIAYPSLTSINQNIKSKGKRAADTIIKVINNESINEKELIMPISICERESVMDL